MQIHGTTILFLFTLLVSNTVVAQETSLDFDTSAVAAEVVATVESRFYDVSRVGEDWSRDKSIWKTRIEAARSREEFAAGVNQLLATLGASHTRYFARSEPRFYQLRGVFEHLFASAGDESFAYRGIGVDTITSDGRMFVSSLYDGSPAESSGLKVGDEIVSLDGKPLKSLAVFPDSTSELIIEIRRSAQGKTESIPVKVEQFDGRRVFELSLYRSMQIYESEKRTIAYVHMWSYAGEKYHAALKEAIVHGKLSHCDALVLDLRDGWGGANIDYVNLFRELTAKLTMTNRNGEIIDIKSVWSKPVALLVNERTTSGKEMFAYAFKKLKLGKVIGAKTAGAVLGGQLFTLSNGDMLYLAVADVRIDGIRLEGIGVEPDIEVARPIPYSAGKDPQLEKAIEVLTQELSSSN